MKKGLFLLLPIFLSSCVLAQKRDKKLQRKLDQLIQGFNGDIGIYVQNLRTGKAVAINADTVFPTASIIKVPILVGVMNKVVRRQLSFDSGFVYKDSLLYAGVDILGSFKDGEKIKLKNMVMLMLTASDNTASLWLQSLAGGGARINEIMDSIGLVNTKVNSRVPGREAHRARYQWGQTTPKEMAVLFEKIYRYRLYTPAACDVMLRNLGRNFWYEDEALSQIPPYIEVFSKNGCVNAVRNEVLIVNAPNNPYILSIFTKNNKDTSWEHNNEARILTRKLSKMLWNYFEPKDKWTAKDI